MRRRCAFLAICLIVPGSAAIARAAAAAPLEVQYDAYAAGFPAVTLQFRIDQTGDSYGVSGHVRTNGVADWVAHYRLQAEAGGRIAAETLTPTDYETTSIGRGDKRVVHIHYAGDAIQVSVTPPLRANEHKPGEEEIGDTVDPLTAILSVGHRFAATGRCDARFKVFDGRRRYDLVMADQGDEDLPAGFGIFHGRARHCTAELVKFIGPIFDKSSEGRPAEPAKKHAPSDVWLARPAPDAVPLPVRLDFHSNWGPVTIRLESVKPAATVPESAAIR